MYIEDWFVSMATSFLNTSFREAAAIYNPCCQSLSVPYR